MSIITTMRKQTAVYWAPGSSETGGQDFDGLGARLYADPVEISCRWEDDAKQYVRADGEIGITKSIVYVDRDVIVGGVLALGSLSTMNTTNPLLNVGAGTINAFSKLPNIRATEFLRTAYL